jgi:hypothetical protein
MNLMQALQQIPIKYRIKMAEAIDAVSQKLSDEFFNSLPKEKLLEFNTINKNDKQALRQFVVDNFPDLDKTIMEEIVKYSKGERN